MDPKQRNTRITAEQVLEALRDAFADVPCPWETCDTSSSIWNEVLWENLFGLYEAELVWELPRLLEYFLDTSDTEHIEDVLSFLDVYGPPGEDQNEHAQAISSRLREAKLQSFQGITTAQAGAIRDWLEFVSGLYPEGVLWQPWLERAFHYWDSRAQGWSGQPRPQD